MSRVLRACRPRTLFLCKKLCQAQKSRPSNGRLFCLKPSAPTGLAFASFGPRPRPSARLHLGTCRPACGGESSLPSTAFYPSLLKLGGLALSTLYTIMLLYEEQVAVFPCMSRIAHGSARIHTDLYILLSSVVIRENPRASMGSFW